MLTFGPPEESFTALLWFNVGLGFTCTVFILVFDEIYYKLEKFFTDKENHRTDKDYDKQRSPSSYASIFWHQISRLCTWSFMENHVGEIGTKRDEFSLLFSLVLNHDT